MRVSSGNYRPVVVYVLIFFVSMLLSIGIKRVPATRTVFLRSGAVNVAASRSLSFSSFSPWSSSNSNSNSGKGKLQSFSTTSTKSLNHDASAGGGDTKSKLNYDSSSFGSFKNYSVAVAYQPKRREESNLFKKKHNKPSPALDSPSGEDNLFVTGQSDDGYLAVGVADGVGGWSEAGYDSSAISRELCASIKANFETSATSTSTTPKSLLVKAFTEILSSPKVEIGGTTACLGILTPDRELKVANLGDSWCGLFRDYKLINETKFQTHNFNTPYQLAKIPPQILQQGKNQGKTYIIDTPELADEYTWKLRKDDIILFATDGVTDNVVPEDIELFLKDQFQVENPDLNQISARLVKEVTKVSKDPNFPSAFAQELSKLTGQRYLGGKEDDITIVVVKVN